MFEFDPAKSASNLDKHGLDFEGAQQVWADEDRFEVEAAMRGEVRTAVIGRIGNKHWTVITTRRRDRIRIISARRSRKSEVALYAQNNHG